MIALPLLGVMLFLLWPPLNTGDGSRLFSLRRSTRGVQPSQTITNQKCGQSIIRST